MLCKSKSLSLNWLRERICKSKIQWVPNEPRDLQCRSDIFYMLLNNSVFSENDSSFQVGSIDPWVFCCSPKGAEAFASVPPLLKVANLWKGGTD